MASGGHQNGSSLYGSSPTTAATGWIEYTRTAGTAAPDTFSPWGKVLGVVAARTSSASKSATVSKKIGASYSKVDTSWLQDEAEQPTMNHLKAQMFKENRPRGALAVDAPSGTDDLSRVGAFLQSLEEHEAQWKTMHTKENRAIALQASTKDDIPSLQDYIAVARRQIDTSSN